MSWVGSGSLNFGVKKQSMQVGGASSQMDIQGRMTSKYSLQVDTQNENSFAKENPIAKHGKTAKTLKFKDDSPTNTLCHTRDASGDLPQNSIMKSKLNDSSSK